MLAGSFALALSGQSANAQAVFTITSSSFKDGELLATKNAGNNKTNPNCVGENVSPPLSWTNAPAGTKSYVLLMSDPEGRAPVGVEPLGRLRHSGLGDRLRRRRESASRPTNMSAARAPRTCRIYFGPCTPPGSPHHYTFVLIATDLEPEGAAARPDPRGAVRRRSTATSRARPASSALFKNPL